MERMQQLAALSVEFSPEEKIKRFIRVESQSAELGAAPPPPTASSALLEHVIDDPTYTYIDFARRDSDGLNIPTFRVQVRVHFKWYYQFIVLIQRWHFIALLNSLNSQESKDLKKAFRLWLTLN